MSVYKCVCGYETDETCICKECGQLTKAVPDVREEKEKEKPAPVSKAKTVKKTVKK